MDDETTAFEVRVTDDRMAVVLDCAISEERFEFLLKRVLEEIDRLGLGKRADPSIVEGRLRFALESGPDVSGAVLLEGKPPLPARDGVIRWTSDFFGGGFSVDEETGAIDYRKRLAQPQVCKGQLLAEIAAPVPGTDGRDVFGKLVHVQRPKSARIRAGANVYTNDDQTCYYASISGRIRFASDILSVDDVYTVSGNVDLETGDIRHLGAIVVEGDVQASSGVVAEGDIDVYGLVEASNIQCGGNLSVRGGITGAPGHQVVAAGTIHARFILESEVRAGGDVFVEREIIHSKVYTCGSVNAPGGRFVGSDIVALSGIVVSQAGNEAGVPTQLTVAGSAQVSAEITLRERLISQYEDDLARIDAAVNPVIHYADTLSERKREALSGLLARRTELGELTQCLRREIDAIREIASDRPNADIIVRRMLYPETVLCIRDVKMRVTDEIQGPLRARLLRGKIQFTSVE